MAELSSSSLVVGSGTSAHASPPLLLDFLPVVRIESPKMGGVGVRGRLLSTNTRILMGNSPLALGMACFELLFPSRCSLLFPHTLPPLARLYSSVALGNFFLFLDAPKAPTFLIPLCSPSFLTSSQMWRLRARTSARQGRQSGNSRLTQCDKWGNFGGCQPEDGVFTAARIRRRDRSSSQAHQSPTRPGHTREAN